MAGVALPTPAAGDAPPVRRLLSPSEKIMYSIGILKNPQKDDLCFSDIEEAEKSAVSASIDDDVCAVWDNKSGEVLSIVYQGIVYNP